MLLALVIFLIGAYTLFNIDYHYTLFERPQAQNGQVNPADTLIPMGVYQEWLNKSAGADSVIIVVTASGGGIKASRWTAEVLTRLDSLSEGNFGSSTLLISSVSGGGVGAMYFADGYATEKRSYKEIRATSSRSSLYATVWGLVYGDFWRLLPLDQLGFRQTDRGTALSTYGESD